MGMSMHWPLLPWTSSSTSGGKAMTFSRFPRLAVACALAVACGSERIDSVCPSPCDGDGGGGAGGAEPIEPSPCPLDTGERPHVVQLAVRDQLAIAVLSNGWLLC